MYSTITPFLDIGPAQPAITFAVQLVEKKLVQECTVAVRPSSGLHASLTAKSVDKSLSWDNVGLTAVADVTNVLKEHQPLMWHYLVQLTTQKAWKWNGMVMTREYHPPEVVCNPTAVINLYQKKCHEGLYTHTQLNQLLLCGK